MKAKQVDWSDPVYFSEDNGGMWTGCFTEADVKRELLRVHPKQPCSCVRCSLLKKQLAACRRSRLKLLTLAFAPPIVAVLAGVGLAVGSYEHGRNEAIQRYRDECIGVEKKHRNEFTLLYVDEYRASNCEEAIRLIWGTP